MPFKLAPRDMMIAISVGAAAVLILFLLFGFRPKLTELSDVRAQQQVEQDKLAQNKLKLKRLDAIRLEAADIEARRIALTRRMPQDPEVPSFIIDLQKTANDADLDLASLSLSEPSEQAGYKVMSFSIQGTASFYTVVDFLYRLEQMRREVVVDSISLAPSGYPLLSVSIQAHTFTLSEKAISKTSADAATGGQPAAGSAGTAPTGEAVPN